MNTAKVEAGSTCVVFGAGMVGLGAVSAADCRAPSGSSASTCRTSGSKLAPHTARQRRWSAAPTRRADPRGDGWVRRRLHVRGDRQRQRHAPGRRVGAQGWGLATVRGVAGKGETLDIIPRYLITGRRVAGSSFGGFKGREGARLVERWLAGEIDVEPSSRTAHARRRRPRLRADGGADGIRSVIEFRDRRARRASGVALERLLVAEDGGSGVLVDSNGSRSELERRPRTGHHHDPRPLYPRPRRPRCRSRGAGAPSRVAAPGPSAEQRRERRQRLATARSFGRASWRSRRS